jgi:uncharacterized membrane protein
MGARYDADAFGRMSEAAARFLGTGRFLAGQTILVAGWIVLNTIVFIKHWDPYPFILLNLAFSTQAAYAAPLILLAQNRQDDRDRANIQRDREVAARTQADAEFLARELAAVRLALADVVTTRDLEDSLSRLAKLVSDHRFPTGPVRVQGRQASAHCPGRCRSSAYGAAAITSRDSLLRRPEQQGIRWREPGTRIEGNGTLAGTQHDAGEAAAAGMAEHRFQQLAADPLVAVCGQDECVAEVSPAAGHHARPWHPLEDSQVHHPDRPFPGLSNPGDPASGLPLEPGGEPLLVARITRISVLLTHPFAAEAGQHGQIRDACLPDHGSRHSTTIYGHLASQLSKHLHQNRPARVLPDAVCCQDNMRHGRARREAHHERRQA